MSITDEEGTTSAPLTKEVSTSLEYLRQAITEVSNLDEDLGDTMTAIVDDLCVNVENQLLLMFANFGSKAKEREELLLTSQQHEDVLSYYQDVQAKLDKKNQGMRKGHDPRSPRSAEVPHGHRHSTPSNSYGNASGIPHVGASSGGQNGTFMTEGAAPAPGIVQQYGGGGPPEVEAYKALSTSLYGVLESVAFQVQAERAAIYLHHKGSGTLRVVCSTPDQGPVTRGAFVAAHQGIPGATFSTGVAISLNKIDPETMKIYVKPTDNQTRMSTSNCMTFPIQDSVGRVLGVFEVANRLHQSRWSPHDEHVVYYACNILAYLLTNYEGVDFHSSIAPFNPVALHTLQPYRPKPLPQEFLVMPEARDQKTPQLVARIKEFSDVPLAVKGKGAQAAPDAEEVKSIMQVKEIQSYLQSIDISYRHTMTELVAAKEREIAGKEDTTKRLHRIRVLEGNISYLHEQLAQHTGAQFGGGAAGSSPQPDGGGAVGTATLGHTLGLSQSPVGSPTGNSKALVSFGRDRLMSTSTLTNITVRGGPLASRAGSIIGHPDKRKKSVTITPHPIPKQSPNVTLEAPSINLGSAQMLLSGEGTTPAPVTSAALVQKRLLLEDAQATLMSLKSVALQSVTAKQRSANLSPIRGGGERSASATLVAPSYNSGTPGLSPSPGLGYAGSAPRKVNGRQLQPVTSSALEEIKKRKSKTPGLR